MSQPKCRIGDHAWEASPRGTHEVCAKCGDRYPCAGPCSHFDCIVDTGRDLPEHVTYHPTAEISFDVAFDAPDESDDTEASKS